MLKDYKDCGMSRLMQTLHFAVADEIEKKMPFLKVPTLIVRGEKDKIASAEWTRTLMQLLPEGQLVTIPHKAHAVNYNAPQELAQIIHEYLTSLIDFPKP